MEEYYWYKIFNATEFLATGLASRTYTPTLEGIGQKTILVTFGVALGIVYDDVFLSAELNDNNPFEFDGHAIYRKPSTDDVYLGILIA